MAARQQRHVDRLHSHDLPVILGHPTMKNLFYAALRERIVFGELQPGERLVEADLATRFRVSKTPIREALRTLEAEGRGAGVDSQPIAELPVSGRQRTDPESMPLRWALIVSRNCSPTFIIGLSEFMAPWGMRAISAKRAWRIASSERRSRSTPSNSTSPLSITADS